MLRHKAIIQCARVAFGYGGIYDEGEGQDVANNTRHQAPVVPVAPKRRAPINPFAGAEVVDVTPEPKQAPVPATPEVEQDEIPFLN
jgi:hypothetical protein